MKMAECVVFDIDDTLYLERDYARSGFEAVGKVVEKRTGRSGFWQSAWKAFELGARGRVFDVALDELGIAKSDELIGELVTAYRCHQPQISLLPDARRCLEALGGRVKLAGVTDGPVESQHRKAEALDLLERLEPLVLTGELGSGFGKPHPRAFELVEAGTGAQGSRCLYVADNPAKDFSGPRSLGWCTLRVRRPGGLHYERESGPDVDAEVTDLAGLAALIGLT